MKKLHYKPLIVTTEESNYKTTTRVPKSDYICAKIYEISSLNFDNALESLS
jgi:hypothetical protein